MLKEVKLPEVSDNVETGDVLKVLVNVGDTIKIDQPLVELETEKATFEVPSTESGVVKEINVKQGDIIRIGQVILKVETNGAEEKKEDLSKTEAVNERSKPEPQENLNKTQTESKLSTDNNAVEVKDSNEISESSVRRESAPASPSVRRLARELGVEINSVIGSGIGGRITESDVKNFVKSAMRSGTASAVSSVRKQLPDFRKWGEVEIEQMSKIRSITADAMTYAWTTIPSVTQFDKADITGLEEFRKKYAKKFEAQGAHLTITSILVKVCTAALKRFKPFNASIDLEKKEIIFKKYFNIGIAVDTDRGLLVPVIKNTDKKSITEISIELNELAEKSRNKKILPDEMEGGNFTISNLGGIGGTGFTPIIYSPQVAILGVSRAGNEPVYTDGQFQPRLMIPLSLTYDHRIIDGADAARFLRWVCEVLENPLQMYL